MSDTNLASLFYAAESAFAETPDLASTLKELRWTGDTLTPNKQTIESQEIRNERDTLEVFKVGESVSGAINNELMAGDYNDFFEAVMMTAWVTSADTVTGTWSDSGETFTLDSGSFSAGLQGAKLIKVADAATSGHDGVHRAVSISSTVITFESDTVTADDAADEVTLTYNYLRPGTTIYSFLIEKHYSSLSTPQFLASTGVSLDQLVLTMAPKSAITCAWNVMGARTLISTATHGDGSPTSASTNAIMNTSSAISHLLINGVANACVSNFTATIANNLRERDRLGTTYTKEFGKGRVQATGQLDMFFDTAVELTAFLNHTSTTLQKVIADAAGNKYSLFYPQLQFTAGNAPTEGIDTDIIQPLAFTAERGPTATPYPVQIDYVSA